MLAYFRIVEKAHILRLHGSAGGNQALPQGRLRQLRGAIGGRRRASG